MTYDWDPYKDICHRLYVDERRSFAQVARYMAENHGFTPRYVNNTLRPSPSPYTVQRIGVLGGVYSSRSKTAALDSLFLNTKLSM